MDDQFLGPPFPIAWKNVIVTFSNPEDRDAKLFAPQQLQKLLNVKLLNTNFEVYPYNLYCSSIKSILKKAYCQECKLYFTTQARYLSRNKNIHRKTRCIESAETSKFVKKEFFDNDYSLRSYEKTFENFWTS